MNLKTRPLQVVLAALALFAAWNSGCDKNPLGTVEIKGHAPFLSSAVLTPASVYIDSLTPSGGVYSFPVIVRVKVTDADGLADISTVNGALIRPSGSTPYFQFPLVDDGVLPDSTVGDGMYAARLQFGVIRSQTGPHRIQLSALDGTNLNSNGLEITLDIKRRNSIPVLSDLSAPDTVTLPVGGAVIVIMSIAAADSDGLSDIQQVYFRSLTSSSPDFKFFLKDDGGADPPPFSGWPSSGDVIAGDGIYTIEVPLVDGQAQRRTNTFAFQTIDAYGDTSATVIHYLTVR